MPRRRRRRACGTRPDGAVLRTREVGGVKGACGRPHPPRGFRSNRRFRSRPVMRSRPCAITAKGASISASCQRRRHGSGRGYSRTRSGRDAVRHLLEDLHHPGDTRERVRRRARGCSHAWRRACGRAPFRRGIDQCGRGREIRHRYRQHVRFWIGSAGATRSLPRSACRRARDRAERFHDFLAGFRAMDEHFRTAPFQPTCRAARPHRHLEHELHVCHDPACALTTSTCSVPGVLHQLAMRATQARGHARACVGYDTGTIWWASPVPTASFVLPAESTGSAWCVRFHRVLPVLNRSPTARARPTRPARREHACAGGVSRVRQGCGDGARRGNARSAGPASRFDGDRPQYAARARLTRMLSARWSPFNNSVFTQASVWGIDAFDHWAWNLARYWQGAPRRSSRGDEPALQHDGSTQCAGAALSALGAKRLAELSIRRPRPAACGYASCEPAYAYRGFRHGHLSYRRHRRSLRRDSINRKLAMRLRCSLRRAFRSNRCGSTTCPPTTR